MLSSSRRVVLAALIAGLPASAPPLAQAANATPPADYHLAAEPGHGPLLPAHWSGDGDDRRCHRPLPPFRWAPRHGGPQQVLRFLAPRDIEHRLRRQHVHVVGRMVLHHGVYRVPALDRHARRVLLLVDPATAAILGRQHQF